jgi:hypothetical protein
MSIYDDHRFEDSWWDHERQMYQSSRKVGRPLGVNAPHYPNKNEAKALRRIMAQTGLTKDEVLAQKAHRRTLAQEAKKGTLVDIQKQAEREEAKRVDQKRMDGLSAFYAAQHEAYKKTPEYLIELLSKEYK